MKKHAIMFSLMMAACGGREYVNVPGDAGLPDAYCDYETQTWNPVEGCTDLPEGDTIIVINTEEPDCDWATQNWNVTDGCVDMEEPDPEIPEYCQTTERRLRDRDGDGYGNPVDFITVSVCEPWTDGYVNWIQGRDDCNDRRDDIHPGAQEICDGVDNDCDGSVDLYMGVDMRTTFYLDADQDGYGNPNHTELRCSHGGLMSATNGLDCDDTTGFTYPGAPYEWWCDGIDHDCNGIPDENCQDASFQDNDQDGYRPADGDCDDFNDTVNPEAEEICDGVDNNCDGLVDPMRVPIYFDADGDGYGIDDVSSTALMCPDHALPSSYVLVDGDCHGLNASIYPDAPEVCGDGVDQDCDGQDLACQTPNGLEPLDAGLSLPPNGGTYTIGATGVQVVAYAMGNYNDAPVTIESLSFLGQGDDDNEFMMDIDADIDLNEHITYCSLVDGVSFNQLDGPVAVTENNWLIFNDFSHTVPANGTVRFLLVCGFANVDTLSGNDDAYRFILGSVGAYDNEGNAVHVHLPPNTMQIPVITITDIGSLSAQLHSESADSGIVLGDTTGALTSMFRFTPGDEDFMITDFTLENCVDYGGDDDCDTYGEDNAIMSIEISYLTPEGGVTKTSFFSNGRARFSGLNLPIRLADVAGHKNRFVVRVNTNSVSSIGATSGDTFAVSLVQDGFRAVGQDSGQLLESALLDTGSFNAIPGPVMTLRKTKPTITLASDSPGGAGLRGRGEVLKINIAADSRGPVEIIGLTLRPRFTDNANTDWNSCQELAHPTMWAFVESNAIGTRLDDEADWTFTDAAGMCSGDLAEAQLELMVDETQGSIFISQGAVNEYSFYLETGNASAYPDDSIRLDIVDIIWSDGYAISDGTLIRNLPVIGGTITF